MGRNLRRLLLLLLRVVLWLGLGIASVFGGRNVKVAWSTDQGGPAHNPKGTCASMIQTRGYDCQEHTVTTKDGYILSMQRIPKGRNVASGTGTGTGGGSGRPVLLQHGLIMDGVTWLLNSPDQSFAFILADNGYDVWIANSRGTKWSSGHTSLGSSDDPAFWDWSWDELAAYDLPAFVEYVQEQTGQNMYYVGHSLGTLMALASLSQRKLVNMLRAAALLSPIAYLGQMPSPLATAAAKTYAAETLYKLGVVEFDPNGEPVGKMIKGLCNDHGINCYDLMSSFTGPNCCLNSSTINLFLEYEPQPTATKNMVHLAQMIRKGTISMYDYGSDDGNMQNYGQVDPPVYNMRNIPNDFPLFLSYGGKDAVSDVNDVQSLLESLKAHDSDKLTVEYRDDYAHADFVMGVNANQFIYEPMMAFFKLQS
ncbi:hypothetical protein ACLOJK_000713 [Asimina triloba]